MESATIRDENWFFYRKTETNVKNMDSFPLSGHDKVWPNPVVPICSTNSEAIPYRHRFTGTDLKNAVSFL